MRAQQLRSFAALKSQEWRSGTSQERQDAVGLIRGVGIRKTMFRHVSGSSNGCLPTRQLPQWK
eukprot:4727288-Pyramimonas_sp.AAC.1